MTTPKEISMDPEPVTIHIHVTPDGSFTTPPPLQMVRRETEVRFQSDQGYKFAVKFQGSSPFEDFLIQDDHPRPVVHKGQFHYSVAVYDSAQQKVGLLAGCPELDVT
jgi:hypothetical protein